MNENYIPEEYTPISMWGYFGYSLLFSIPIVGSSASLYSRSEVQEILIYEISPDLISAG